MESKPWSSLHWRLYLPGSLSRNCIFLTFWKENWYSGVARYSVIIFLLLACYVRLCALDAFKKLNVFRVLDGLNIWSAAGRGAGLCRGHRGPGDETPVPMIRTPATAHLTPLIILTHRLEISVKRKFLCNWRWIICILYFTAYETFEAFQHSTKFLGLYYVLMPDLTISLLSWPE